MKQDASAAPVILGIDTSCDETSAAVSLGSVVLSNIIASQAQIHQQYGGVFPTLAKRAHQQNIEPAVTAALNRAGVKAEQLDAVAVTVGPGLAPALEVGVEFAQNYATKINKPLIATNHLESHVLSVLAHRQSRHLPIKKILQLKTKINKADSKKQALLNKLQKLSSELPPFTKKQVNSKLPVLAIVVSGGNTLFALGKKVGDYQILGQTIDDAAGEALDKVGRMLNLGYPAALVIEELAKQGDPHRFQFPLPMTEKKNFNLSYSGLKTSAHRLIKKLKSESNWSQQTIVDFSASFQFAVFRHLCYKLDKLLASLADETDLVVDQVWLGGGVARNISLRKQLRKTAGSYQLKLKTPFEKRLCSDNAAMVAITGCIHYSAQNFIPHKNPRADLDRRPNWALDQVNY